MSKSKVIMPSFYNCSN